MAIELTPDDKGNASMTLGDVIVQTRTNFPDARFHPNVHLESRQYHRYGINPHGFEVWPNADGIGTKPEFAERLYSNGRYPGHFETLAYDTFAMIDGDTARFGQPLLGITQVIDTNQAQDSVVINELARGTKKACDQGRFPLLNGETAELGYRTSGYGSTRINWNATGLSLIIPNKIITGERLEPGQPVVGLRETSIRSNGLSKARAILEANWLREMGYASKEQYVTYTIAEHLTNKDALKSNIELLDKILGHSFLEQVLVPWHDLYPIQAGKILAPSTLYGKLIYEAQGGIDGEKLIDITGAAHISGGGVPEKGKRMVEDLELGLHIESPFPDPEAVDWLMDFAERLPDKGKYLIDDRSACQQWNRGIGFMIATATSEGADEFIKLAVHMGYEAAVVGEVTDKKEITFRGYTWTY